MVKATLGLYRYSSYVNFSTYRTCGLMLVLVQSPGPQVIPHPAPWPSL